VHVNNGLVNTLEQIGLWGPYTQGAVSWASAGNYPARITLTQPVQNKLWFAGEALSMSTHSQTVGAFITGQAAAFGVLSELQVI
jgi:hypothetical protein